jgi:hypothetical protein
MTKDEALIYWVMRFGSGGSPTDDMFKDDTVEHRAWLTLTPLSIYQRGGWYLSPKGNEWKISKEGLQRLKEIGHD